MIWRLLILCLVFHSGWLPVTGQVSRNDPPSSNLRQKVITTKKDSIYLDSLSIVPNTVSILGIADSSYTIDHVNALLTWKTRPGLDSVLIRYRVFPTRLNAIVRRMVYDSVMNNFLGERFIPDYGGGQHQDKFFNFGNINYNGSFGRGISFGNSQDAVVTSNLNLQLSGYLADSIEIAAAITDNNIPIQPDGTTQQLNEFDRIFLQFKKKNWKLSLGDIDIRQNESYFLNFYKRLQGIAFETINSFSKNTTNRSVLSGSIAKGKFARNIFQGQEGNQGPYRLSGANNEFFFVVLANTERVYLDGELLQRGEDQDYVINYNTAEIAFTPKRMITKDRRIQVEFEYSDRNYLNANLYLFNETNFNNKVKLRVGLFNNSDAKNSPINQTLDAKQKRFLDSIGDNITQALYPNALIDTFSSGRILYRKIDTIYNGGGDRDSIYIFSTSADSLNYSLSFLDVGIGFGDYIPDFNGANGKVYKWIAPVSGQKQGRYQPAIFLVTPKKHQLATLGLEYNINPSTVVATEIAMSTYDVNRFSAKEKSNDKGYAARLLLKNTRAIGDKLKALKLITDVGYEFVDARFRPLERLRNVEFTRDWGLPIIVTPANETIVTAGIQLSDAINNSVRYQLTAYDRNKDFTGIRNTIFHYQSIRGWKFNNMISLSNVSSQVEKGYFFRPNISVSRIFPKFKNYSLGFAYSLEHNEIHKKVTDSISPQSFSFQTFQITMRSSDAKLNRWGITYFTRTDAYPFGKELIKVDRSQNVNLFTELLKSERHQLRLNATYRTLEILKPGLRPLLPDKSLLGRAEYQVNEWKGLVTGNFLYEVGAGQEQKRDYAFLEVPAGQGEYTWIDYDSNQVQSLNEFEVALFQDQAKYIRIFTPTNEFVKANYNTFNYSIGLNPRSIINLTEAKGLSRFFARVNLQSSLQINKKEIAKGVVQLNPFGAPLSDTSLITLNQIFINTFSFNRFSSKWGFDINNSRNGVKSLLTYGYETRKFTEWTLRGRFNITRIFSLDMTGKKGANELVTSNPKFGNRNFRIQQYSIEPRVTFTKGANFRFISGYKFSVKENETGSREKAISHSLNNEVKYNILQSTSIQAKFTFNNISFTAGDNNPNTNSPAAYIMLDGLLPGKNFLWTIDLTKRLSNTLELNMQYEGRKPGSARVVHIGRASIRALL